MVAAASAATVRLKADTTDVATAQIPFDQAIRDLSSADSEARLRAASPLAP